MTVITIAQAFKYHDTIRYSNINKNIINYFKYSSPFYVTFSCAGSDIATLKYLGRRLITLR